jgi:uncharacterized protein (TIGR00255 family)
MLRSMTAFGKAKKAFSDVTITVTLQSVNKKFLDIHCKLPPEFASLEQPVRNLLTSQITRGHVTVLVHAFFPSKSPVKVELNMPLALEFKNAIDELQKLSDAQVSEKDIILFLLQAKDLFSISYETKELNIYQEALEDVFNIALVDFIALKEREGRHITEEFAMRLLLLKSLISEIGQKGQGVSQKYAIKIRENLQKIGINLSEGDERLVKEIAIMAEKLDVSEEISRALYHIEHFEKLLSSREQIQGKVLEFILQELGREVNTIGSKVQDAHIATLVISAKSEIEKMREQVQNVE